MIAAHYLHKWPAVVLLTLGLWLDYEPLGAMVFAGPPRETSIRYGGKTWELARLWVSDDCPRNTESWFIARAIKFIKRNNSEVKCLVSYADPSQGHSGIIYKASNWESDGMSELRSDAWVGERRFGRVGDLKTRDTKRLEPRPRKHRFIYRLVTCV